MSRVVTMSIVLLFSQTASAGSKSSAKDEGLFSWVELEVVKMAVLELVESSLGYDYDEVISEVCDDDDDTESLLAEAEFEGITEAAAEFHGHEFSARNGDILDHAFPSDAQNGDTGGTGGWVCNYEEPPCADGSPIYSAETTASWDLVYERLGAFGYDTESDFFRICYSSEGTDDNSTLQLRTETDLDCDGEYIVHEQTMSFDASYDLVISKLTVEETTESTVIGSSDDDSKSFSESSL